MIDTHSGIAAHFVTTAREVVDQDDDHTLPIDPFRLARQRRITDVVREPSSRDGLLIPSKSGFVVRINSAAPYMRQRFAMAHEIAHTFLFDLSENPPRRVHEIGAFWKLEGLCNLAAEELLLPYWATQDLVEAWQDASIRTFLGLASRFAVSPEVLAHRLRRLELGPVIVVWARRGTEGRPEPQVFSPRKYRGLGLRRNAEPSSLQVARSTGRPSISEDVWRLRTNKEKVFLSESAPLDGTNLRYLTLVYPELSDEERAAIKAERGVQLTLLLAT